MSQEILVCIIGFIAIVAFKLVQRMVAKKKEMDAQKEQQGGIHNWRKINEEMKVESARNFMRTLMIHAVPDPRKEDFHFQDLAVDCNGYLGEERKLHVMNMDVDAWGAGGLPKSVKRWIARQLPGEFQEVLIQEAVEKKLWLRTLMRTCKPIEELEDQEDALDMEVDDNGCFEGTEHISLIGMDVWKKGGLSKSVRRYCAKQLPGEFDSELVVEEENPGEEKKETEKDAVKKDDVVEKKNGKLGF